MAILIDVKPYKSSIKARLDYLLNRDKEVVEVLEGNPNELLHLSREIKDWKLKAFNFLISFRESKEELEAKLKEHGKTIQDLNDEINRLIFAGYDMDRELCFVDIAHTDTDNYHIHKTVLSKNLLTGTQVYFPRGAGELEYLRTIEKYISLKYGISLEAVALANRGKTGTARIKKLLEERGNYKVKQRDEVKEEITNILSEQIALGVINSRDELIEELENIGLEVVRKGKNYITIRYGDTKIRLKGGIYDEQRFGEIKENVREPQENAGRTIRRKLEQVERKLNELYERRIQRIGKRFEKARARAEKEIELLFGEPVDNKHNSRLFSRDNFGILAMVPSGEREYTRKRNSEKGTVDKSGKLFSGGRENVGKERGELARSEQSNLYLSLIDRKLEMVMKNWQEKRKEELDLIKSISPEDIFADLGIPFKKEGSYYKALAVWRGEKTPSVKVAYQNGAWLWHDFGTGEGGSWIDLYMKAKGWDYITAVRYLRENLLGTDLENISFLSSPMILQRYSDWELSEVKEKPISRQVIKRFLEQERKIKHIPDWLKEIDYELVNRKTGEVRHYFGFGVKDEAGNYHIRFAIPDAKVKERVIRTNDEEGNTYSLVRKGSNSIAVVEGFIDAIRIEELYPDSDILILNGVENYKKALEELKGYSAILIATDKDNAGIKVANEIKKRFANKELYELDFTGKDLDEAVKSGADIKANKIEFKEPDEDWDWDFGYGPSL